MAAEEFLGEGAVGLGAGAGGVVIDDRFAEAGGFAEADAAGDDGFVDDFGEVFADLFNDLLGQVRAGEHGHDDAAEGESGIGAAILDLPDDADDF